MKNLNALMREFAILGMEPEPLESENGLEFPPQAAAPAIAPAPAVAPVAGPEEYELDAEGNPVLDANGNPVKKVADPACACHDDPAAPAGALPALPPLPPLDTLTLPGLPPPAAAAPAELPPLPPEDEFDFKV